LLYSELSENYEKMTLISNFENWEKLVLTQIPTRTFEFKFGMQGLKWDVPSFFQCMNEDERGSFCNAIPFSL